MDKKEWGGKFHLTAHSIWASPFFFSSFSSFFDFYIFCSLPFVSFPFLQSLSYRSDLFVLLVIIALFGYFGPFLFPRWDSFPLSLSLSLFLHPLFSSSLRLLLSLSSIFIFSYLRSRPAHCSVVQLLPHSTLPLASSPPLIGSLTAGKKAKKKGLTRPSL